MKNNTKRSLIGFKLLLSPTHLGLVAMIFPAEINEIFTFVEETNEVKLSVTANNQALIITTDVIVQALDIPIGPFDVVLDEVDNDWS